MLATVAWLPLVVGAAASGGVAGLEVFFRDIGLHARLLLGVPFLLVAELAIGRRFGNAVRYLGDAGLVDGGNRRAVSGAVALAHRMRDAWWAEATLALVALASPWAQVLLVPSPEPWMYTGPRLSIAGIWYGLVSVVLYRFLLLRWAWRLVIWTTLLLLLARAPLKLKPAHPDRLGGLSVLTDAHQSFGWLVFALSVTVAGFLTANVQFGGASVLQYRYSVAAFGFGLPLVFLAPPLVFSWRLELLRRRVHEEYGATAASHGSRFRDAWLRAGSPPLPLEAPDTSTHTDMTTSFDRSVQVRRIPFRWSDYLFLLACGAVPLVLFLVQAIPLLQILQNLRELLG